MTVDNFRLFEDQKFGWDGTEYDSMEAAREKAKEYEKNGFDIEIVEEDEGYYVFSRRIVTEIQVEGGP